MSLRRSRIKPAINLAASRRSAVGASNRPKVVSGDAKSATNPTQTSSSHHSKVTSTNEPKQKESPAPLSCEQPSEGGKSDGNVLLPVREINDGKTGEVDKGQSDKKDAKVRTDKDEPRSTVAAKEKQETSSASSIATEGKGDNTSTQETSKNLSQVRRKRITAVPNIGRRRLPSPAKEPQPARQKQTDGKSDARNETKTLSISSENQEEQGKKENKTKKVSGDSKRKDSTDNEFREESIVRPSVPPTVQRKVLSQVFQPQGEKLHDESPSLHKKDGSSNQKDANKPEIQEKEPALAEPVEKSRKDQHRQKSLSGNIYQKRLTEMEEGKKEETPSYKRRKYIYDPENGIDTSKMKMKDLIYYNPKENKMLQMNGSSKQVKEKHPEEEEEVEMEEVTSSTAAPQVKIGPDGQIILDRQSLVQVVTPKRKLDESEMTEVKEDSSTTTYSSFRKPRLTSVWSKEDTEKFYRAISTVGTDFSMINAIFPKRKRRELKNKFKREEKLHAELMDKALKDIKTFDFSDFQHAEEDDEEEEEISVDKSTLTAVTESDKSFKKPLKKKKRRKKDDPEDVYVAPKAHRIPVPIVREDENNITEEQDENNVSEEPPPPTLTESSLTTETSGKEPDDNSAEDRNRTFENLQHPFGTESPPSSSGEEEDYDMKTILGKPTRSGRKPKQREVFTIQESLSQPRIVRTNQKSISQQNREMSRKRNKKSRSKSVNLLPQTHLPVTDPLMQGDNHPVASSNPSYMNNSSSSIGSHLEQVEYNLAPSSINDIALLDHNMSPQREGTHPPVRLEHYLVTYPDGRRTLIQMPVPDVAENSFDFVLMPSPVRQGNVLQIGVVPRIGSPLHEPSHTAGSPGVFSHTVNHHSLSHSQLNHQRVQGERLLETEAGQQTLLASESQGNIRQDSQGTQSSSFMLHNVGSPSTAAASLSSSVHFQTDRGKQLLNSVDTSLSRTQNMKREMAERTEVLRERSYSSIENSMRSMPTEMVYVRDLVDPLQPSGSEVSDPIIAQQIDVSSSVQNDEVDSGESEAFVPI